MEVGSVLGFCWFFFLHHPLSSMHYTDSYRKRSQKSSVFYCGQGWMVTAPAHAPTGRGEKKTKKSENKKFLFHIRHRTK